MKKGKPLKEWVRKQTTYLGENKQECVQLKPPLSPKHKSERKCDPFDVILKNGDLVKYSNNGMPEI